MLREGDAFSYCDVPQIRKRIMITEIPTPIEYRALADDCLIKAFELVFEVDNYFILPEVEEGGFTQDDIDIFNNEFDDDRRREIYLHRAQDFRTALVLVHQGLESLCKATVCATSPFLLLLSERSTWPVLPESLDKPFSGLYTVSGEELLRVYGAVTGSTLSEEMVKFYEATRILRNRLQHGGSTVGPDSKTIIKSMLNTYTLFAGSGTWWTAFWKFWLTDPNFGTLEIGSDYYHISRHLNYAEKVVGVKELSKHFDIDLSGARSYYCPICNIELERECNIKGNKWAYFYKTEAEVFCVCCQRTSPVLLQNCEEPGCKGEIASEKGVCLTCLKT